jgi:hypothetical protein
MLSRQKLERLAALKLIQAAHWTIWRSRRAADHESDRVPVIGCTG